ncbi:MULTISPECIES: phage tail tape measure protein [unclassified Cryobacterium]|uniref:phage tail tape measure protein n=1 Tax=unclassified Cryobacterium TaxID=2649013 RepID=UPI00106CCF4E|nr:MULTISPECIES: phage tail tape measure protein [unclassified Cryobacterium]TFC59405.1 phage tail tape measure protein [Cryobacterium sp. TMB3-1-2]TFC67201.1 phage tail tape measure protein [Cryobacterium sp. TMB3-15]TFC73286.1 phage tail tape measure protein [Cryobacterium sp. TMB3-10]TFD46174.1 phage tail tape measure protein [Cryobacterium sp. TMB3-12]
MSGSAMHEAGSIGFRLAIIGKQVFQKDTDDAEKSVVKLGKSAKDSAAKVAPLGDQVDKTAKAAKGAKAPLDDAAGAADRLGGAAENANPKVEETAAKVAELQAESEEAATSLGTLAVGIGAAFAAMAVLTVGAYATFDEASSKTAAATMATREQQDLLKASAIEQGAASVYSATEAADAQTELAKAGVSVNDILGGGLSGSLALAAAGELAVARAAEIAATTLTVFSLKGDQAGHVADLLAAGAGKAQGSVDDLALGLDYVGVTFARLNIPLEDTVGTLALLAANGLLGEKAGTGLRSVISSLTSPVAKASEVMKQYNIDVFDGTGNFIGMAGAAEQLKMGLGDLDEETRSAALGAIFGAEAATAAGILYSSGAKGVEDWTNNVNDQGYAAEQAAMKTDNLTGDLERLGGSMDSALIKTGSTANDVMREMVQILSGLVDWYGSLDEGVQGTVLAVGAGTAAVFLFGGTALLAIPKIVEFRAAIGALTTTMKGTAAAAGLIGVAITAAVVILGAFGAQQADAKARTDALNDSLDQNTGAFTKNTREAVVSNLEKTGAAKTAKLLGISLGTLTDAALGEGKAVKEVTGILAEHRAEADKSGNQSSMLRGSFNSIEEVINATSGELADAKVAWREHKDAMGESTVEAEEAAPAYVAVEESIDGVITSVSDLATELAKLNGQNLDAREAARALEEAYDSFDESLAENGAGLNELGTDLDTTTEAGREMQSKLDDIAQAALDTGQAIIDSGGKYADYQASLQASRDALLIRISDLGITGQAAQDLADDILAIPTAAEVQVFADTEAAAARLLYIQNLIDGIGGTMAVHVANGRGGGGMTMNEADGGVVSYYANGGIRENHVAQIAKAGAMRVWAEPETEGEGYIPLAQSKRGRSTAVLADIAGKFGYQLVPAGAQAFAGGGVTGGSSGPAPRGDVSIIVNPPPGSDTARIVALVKVEVQEILRSA